ncbi:MFS transporter [Paenarthrobacter sp. NPDC056912]|uniref:MFS transporter n=1 Tax=Paenarthrobacter sp. NPDC056912 TaxID=3345965 RepID=UPI00366CD76E
MFVVSLGQGAAATIAVLFFTRVAGVPLLTFGIVSTVAAVVGLGMGAWLGKLSDRVPVRGLYVVLMLTQACGTAMYALIPGVIGFAILLCSVTAAQRGAAAVRGKFIALLVERAGRVEYRARIRALTNAAAAVGAGVGALVLTSESTAPYTVAMLVIATTFLISGAFIWSCRTESHARNVHSDADVSRSTGREGSEAAAFGNIPFLAVTALNAVLLLHSGIINIAIPLWVDRQTDAPLWIVAVIIVINTLGVVLFQVPATRLVKDIESATRAARGAGLVLAASCVILAASSFSSGVVTIILLLFFAVVHVVAELLQASAGWTFSFEMSPESRIGEYQGVFNAGQDLGAMLSPMMFSMIVAAGSPWPWAVLGVAFLVVGFVIRHIVLRAPVLDEGSAAQQDKPVGAFARPPALTRKEVIER